MPSSCGSGSPGFFVYVTIADEGSVIFETQKPLNQQYSVTYRKTWCSAVLLWEPQILWQLLVDILSFQFKHW